MADTHIFYTILESARKTTSQFRVKGPFSINEAAPSIGKVNDWSMKQVETKIKSFIGKFNDQLQLRHVEPHAYERGFRAGENNSPLTNNVMTNFNKLGSEQKRLAFCAGWAATFNNVDTLKESACPACDEELEEEVVTVYEKKGITSGGKKVVDSSGKTVLARGGKKVILNRPFRTPGAKKKFAVYVRNDKGAILRVSFGDPKMEIKRDNPEKRKSYRARHGCSDPGPKWKANYWSCRMWGRKNVGNIVKEGLRTIGTTCMRCGNAISIPPGRNSNVSCPKCGGRMSSSAAQSFDQQKCPCGHMRLAHVKGFGCCECNCKRGPMDIYEDEQMNLFDQEAIVTDQFFGPNPYDLQKAPLKWEEFKDDVQKGVYDKKGYKPAQIIKATPDYRPAWGTTVFVRDDNGNTKVWKMNWDSSG